MSKKNIALDLFRRMLWIRSVEEAIAGHYGRPGEPQEMRCPVHLSIGQEAVAAGVCAALGSDDVVFSNHRCHAHYLAKGGALEPMMAEIFGKAAGCMGGRGGSMHLMDVGAGILTSVPIVASSVPLAVGAALAFSLDKEQRISIAFIGDAALEEGVWHESANFAKLRKLPVLFVCENNLYSVYTPLNRRQPSANLSRLAHAHEIKVWETDGNDVEAVYDTAIEAIEQARFGNGPAFLLAHTYRYREHCGPSYDDHLGYRPEDELKVWQERDPLTRYREALTKSGMLNAAAEASMRREIGAEIDAALAFARSAPLPDPATVARHVYAD